MAAAAAAIARSRVLTVHGTKDTVIPLDDGREFARAIPGSAFEAVEGADHMFSAHGEPLVRIVVDFIAAHAVSAAAGDAAGDAGAAGDTAFAAVS